MDIFTDVLIPIFTGTIKGLLPIIPYAVFALAAGTVAFLIFNHFYKQGTYYKITNNSYITTRLDLGKYGEYLTYKELRKFEAEGGRFLFNLYIPKEDGETTEIDVILITSSGIFVFESKNYSGWIFGSENQPTWTQTLPQGRGKSRKEHFYNPIMQNKSHVKHLRAVVGEDVPLQSVILFSNRCTLKKVDAGSSGVPVINRQEVADVVRQVLRITNSALTDERIAELYDLLYPFSQTDSAAKAKHIARIKEKTEPQKAEPITPPASDKTPEPETTPVMDEPTLTCPRCGGKLVLRTAKRGDRVGKQFYGCSNYPRCNYTRNV